MPLYVNTKVRDMVFFYMTQVFATYKEHFVKNTTHDTIRDTGDTDVNSPQRLAKRMARGGLCSRREAEKWICEGRVMVNGHTMIEVSYKTMPTDTIQVDGKVLARAPDTKLWRYHKPRGLLVTSQDSRGRPTVFDALPPSMPRVVSVGRLDYNSEGLLLLTNDGTLARRLEKSDLPRCYRVRAFGNVNDTTLQRLQKGVKIQGMHCQPENVRLQGVRGDTSKGTHKARSREAGKNRWFFITLREGKNREVRRIFAAADLTINRLIRLSYGPFHLKSLPLRQCEEAPPNVWRKKLS